MDTSLDVNPSIPREVPSPSSEVLFLGKDLDLELWFKGNTDKKQSVLIRTTTPEGVVKSAFMHIDGTVSQVPTFENEDPLVLEKENKARPLQRKARDFSWSPDKPRARFNGKAAAKIVAGITGLVILFSLLTGFIQLRVVLTGSMKPAINPGDLIVAASTKIATPEVKKIVLYSARDLQGKAVTVWAHRIISGNAKDGFTIKGDANSSPDIGIVPESDIQSVVITRIPKVGRLINPISLILIFSGVLVFSRVLRSRRSQL